MEEYPVFGCCVVGEENNSCHNISSLIQTLSSIDVVGETAETALALEDEVWSLFGTLLAPAFAISKGNMEGA